MALNRKQQEALVRLLQAGARERAGRLVDRLDPADLLPLLEEGAPRVKEGLLEVLLAPGRAARTLRELPGPLLGRNLERMGSARLGPLLAALPVDDATSLLQLVQEERHPELLAALPDEKRRVLEQHLRYPERSAGRLMDPHVLALPRSRTVGEAIEILRRLPEGQTSRLSYLYVVDEGARLCGVLSSLGLLRAPPDQPLGELATPDPVSVTVQSDREEAAALVTRYGFVALPVVEPDGRLVGLITVDDVMDVLTEQATEDLYALQGVSGADTLAARVPEALRSRLPWMVANLVTAFAAAATVGLFEKTIAHLAFLAAFMPVVAGMGGNVGTQVLTVVTRGIALGQDQFVTRLRLVLRQASTSILIGLVTGVLTAAVAYGIRRDAGLSLVLFLAMIINLTFAGLAGVLVPLVLRRLKLDPALGSGVVVTTFTDVVGFMTFLGLATLILKGA